MSPAKPPTHRQCAVQQVNERLTEQHPSLRVKQLRIEHECQRLIEKGEAQRVWRRRITLPVVVHVVYKTDEQNITDEQVTSQIDVLNQDYRATNPDREKIPDAWTSLAAPPCPGRAAALRRETPRPPAAQTSVCRARYHSYRLTTES